MILGDLAEVLQEFNEAAGANWKIVLNRMLRGKETDRKMQAVFKHLTVYVKIMLMEERKTEIQELRDLLDNEILYKLFMQYEEEKVSLVTCYMEKLELFYLQGKKEEGDNLVEALFQNVIVCENEAFVKQYALFGMEREEELRNLGNAMDSIVMEAVKRRLSPAAMGDYLFYKFTSAPEEMNKKIVSQYAKYYEELRNRYCIELQEAGNREESNKIITIAK